MKILIAGATGLIGQEIVRQCHKEQFSVHYLTTSKSKIVAKDNYKGFYWNIERRELDSEAFNGVSVIINLAGATVSKRWTSSYKKTILESRIQTASLIKEALGKISHQVTHYISASGISIYPSSNTHLYTEDESLISDSFLASVTQQWEAAANQFKDLNINVAKIRTGIVLDEEDGAFPKIVQPIKMGLGAPLGSGQQWQSWIHIKDIAGIYLFILKKQLSGIFNGVAPSPVTNEKMTKVIAEILDKPLWMPNTPKFALKLLLGEMSSLVFESQLVSSKKVETAGYHFHYVNVENAVLDLL